MTIRIARAAGMAAAALTLHFCGPAAAETAASNAEQVLDEIVVTATRRGKPLLEVPASVTVQNLSELRTKGFNYGTDEFRGVPGVFFRRGEGDGEEFPFISIRGVTGNHGNDTFLALVDGIPFVGPDEEVLLYEVPYPVVDSIEIVRGPVSTLYGRGAIAGAVNYRTRPLRENRSEVAVSAGSEDFFRAEGHVERSFDNGAGVMLSAAYEDFEGWRENSARELTSVFLKGSLPVGERGSATAWLNYYNREAEVPGVIPTLGDGTVVDVAGGDEGFLGYLPTGNDSEGLIAAARYDYAASDSLSFQVTGQARSFDSDVALNFYDFFEFDPANTIMGVNGFASDNEARVLFGEATVNWTAGRHTIVAGVSGERATLDETDRWSGEFDPSFSPACGFRFYAILIDYSTGQVVNDTPDNACFVRSQLRTVADTTNTFGAAFIQDEIRLSDRLELTLGVRYDRFEREVDFAVVGTQPVDQRATGDADAFSPKASLSYNYGGGIVYTSYGRGFNSNFGPVFQWEPDRYARDEEPTTIDSVEIGWKGRSDGGNFEWETAVFYLEQEDRRIFVPNPDADGPPTLATTGRAYSSRGFEGSLRFRPADGTTAVVNYTYLDPEWDELQIAGSFGAPDVDFSGNTPQGVPENIIYVEVAQEFTGWLTGRLTYEWYDDYFVDLSNNVSAGGYDLLGVSASMTLPGNDALSLDLSITNLLDEDYYFFFAGSRTMATNVTPGVPRLARATLRWRF
ncbi:MAG: TonB-dependent receptor [Pseudomonadota bacterium]